MTTVQQLSLFDIKAETPETGVTVQSIAESQVAELINRRRHQLVIHSEIYYRMNDSLISDETFDVWSRQLVELQAKYPDIAQQVAFAELFKDYDGSTGYHLCGTPWGYSTANWLLDDNKKLSTNRQGGQSTVDNHSCMECHFCRDESEYGDYGSVYYVAYSCDRKKTHSDDDENFPFATAPDCFVLDFWNSKFAEQVDGSEASLETAVRKWTESYFGDEAQK